MVIFWASFLASCSPILVRFFFSDCLLIDLGFRARTENSDPSPAFVIGENIMQASNAVPKAEYADNQEYCRVLYKYFRKDLVIWDKKFPDQDRMDILRKYGNRNSEGIIKDGFYYGCADLCTVIGSVLIHNGYRCKLIYTVSEEFSISENRNIAGSSVQLPYFVRLDSR